MISAFGVDHGGISKAADPQKKKDKQLALAGGAGGALYELGHGGTKGVKGVNRAITAHEAGKFATRSPHAGPALTKLPGKQKAALRTGAAIGGGLARAPHAAAVGGIAGGGIYGIQRLSHRKREK